MGRPNRQQRHLWSRTASVKSPPPPTTGWRTATRPTTTLTTPERVPGCWEATWAAMPAGGGGVPPPFTPQKMRRGPRWTTVKGRTLSMSMAVTRATVVTFKTVLTAIRCHWTGGRQLCRPPLFYQHGNQLTTILTSLSLMIIHTIYHTHDFCWLPAF